MTSPDNNEEHRLAHDATLRLGGGTPIGKMTEADFRALPYRVRWDSDEEPFDSLVILPALPTEELHDSGYRKIDFVGVRQGDAICRLAGSSDVLHFDGIGGTSASPSVWSIDCLAASGLLNLFNTRGQIRVSLALSSFEIFGVARVKG